MSREVIEEVFLKDVVDHKMTVLHDDGIYRHLRFASTGQYSWNQWFEIITWPGKLAYSGDMGTYVFARLEDMFEFFRTRPREGKGLYINLGYWGEKLEAVDRHNGYLEFSPSSIQEKVNEIVSEWIEDNDLKEEEAASLREAIEDEISYDNGKDYAYRSISEFSHQVGEDDYWKQDIKSLAHSSKPKFKTFEFQDIFEWRWDDYTVQYVWCCYALSWAIKTYDEFKDAA